MASLAKTLQNYLEEQIKEDTALASVYDASKINDCAKYVTEQARKLQSGGCAVIEDAVVYKWSRDFYYGDTTPATTEKKEETIEVKTATVVTQKKPKEEPKEKKQKKAKAEKKEDGFDKYDMCLFADISEEDLWSK